MSRQFNTQNYQKNPRFRKVYLNFLDNQGHYDFRGVVENPNGIILQPANPQDFYMAPVVGINYAYLGGILHECNYEVQTTNLTNGKQYTFSLGKVVAMRAPKGEDPVRVDVFDYAKAAFKVCYNPNGWGGNHSQPTLIGLSPITEITVIFAGSAFNPQINMNTVYSNLMANGTTQCNRFNWKEYRLQNHDYRYVQDYMRYESWGYPGVGFVPNNFDHMMLSLFDNQTDPRQTISGQANINVPIAAVRYLYEIGDSYNPDLIAAYGVPGGFAPLAYFIEENVDSNSDTYCKYRFNMIRSCNNAFNVNGVFDGTYKDLVCKSLIRHIDDGSIDNHDESVWNNREFYSYPETTRLIGYIDSL